MATSWNRIGDVVGELVSEDGGVVIQADRDSTTGLLVDVMARLREAGVEDVAVAARRGGS